MNHHEAADTLETDEFYRALRQDPDFLRALEQHQERMDRVPLPPNDPEMDPRKRNAEYMQRVEQINAADERFYRAQEQIFRRKFYRKGASGTGFWRFSELLDSHQRLTGWRVDYEGRIVGAVVIRGDDLVVFGGESGALGPQEIMAAFFKLYPGGVPEARALPRGQRALPEGEPLFGPARDWSLEGYEQDGYRRRR